MTWVFRCYRDVIQADYLLQHVRAREAYERVVQDNPNHAKVLQQLGWLYHQDGSSFQNQELAIQYLTKSLEAGEWDMSPSLHRTAYSFVFPF